MDIIPIEKDQIPYKFDITLGGEVYNLRFDYNSTHDFFTCTLSHNDTVIVANDRICYGVPLFSSSYLNNDDFPPYDIIPLDLSGECNDVTWKTFGEKVLLYIDNEEASIGSQ